MNVAELFSLEGKVALITGGSRGIGEMIARGFIASGAKVYISSRKADACNALAAELSKDGTCLPLPADLGEMSEVERLASEMRAREPKLHILVNNAGAAWAEPIGTFTEKGWDKVVDLNLKALFFLTQALLDPLAAAATHDDPARVINIASIDGIIPPALDTFSYSASKSGVIHLTRHLAAKLGSRNITANSIAPGYFPTVMTQWITGDQADTMMRKVPLRRAGRAEDMAGTALYLASKAGAYTTGATIRVDGGLLSDARDI